MYAVCDVIRHSISTNAAPVTHASARALCAATNAVLQVCNARLYTACTMHNVPKSHERKEVKPRIRIPLLIILDGLLDEHKAKDNRQNHPNVDLEVNKQTNKQRWYVHIRGRNTRMVPRLLLEGGMRNAYQEGCVTRGWFPGCYVAHTVPQSS